MKLYKGIRNGLFASLLVYGGIYLVFWSQVSSTERVYAYEWDRLQRAAGNSMAALNDHVGELSWRKALKERHHLPDKASKEHTKIVSVPFFKKVVSREMPVPEYWDALLEKIQIEEQNDVVRTETRERLDKSLASYPHAKKLVADMDAALFAKQEAVSVNCMYFYPGTKRLGLNEAALSDAAGFGRTVAAELRDAERRNEQQRGEYEKALRKARTSLPDAAYLSYKQACEREGVFSSGTREVRYESPALGVVNYQVPSVTFNAAASSSVLARISTNLYANHSLTTGSKPWGYCYGSQNACNGYNCSQIMVIAGGSDVLVTIKDRREEVVRHAYIKSRGSYTFHLSNGSYQPFFYYGKGWNPNKEMKQVACGMLKGGFISGESVGKDDMQYLNNNILTYTLTETRFGNFNTRPSNTNEAL